MVRKIDQKAQQFFRVVPWPASHVDWAGWWPSMLQRGRRPAVRVTMGRLGGLHSITIALPTHCKTAWNCQASLQHSSVDNFGENDVSTASQGELILPTL